jgi:hypothetical protein
MSLLLRTDRWAARRAAAAGPLSPLAQSLARELEPLLAAEPHIPRDKALLSREGGRCAVDGSLLEFDPFARHHHRCGLCGRVYRGELHDRFWTYWYQLWLAERAVHAALLYRLRGDSRHAALARTILAGYVEQYLKYPNRDNVLGPGRVFFSTYIESIWLLQLVAALDLLEDGQQDAFGAAVRDRVIEPSSRLIATYNEGISNRQTWNNAAMMAANVLLNRTEAIDRIVTGPGGLVTHLSRALLSDGTWYEGENYHLFAHRGLWYCVTIAEQLDIPLRLDLVARFQEGFATPLLTALPDLTLVARRDSQYAVSLRQVRFAELCELGVARSLDGRLIEMLHDLYAPVVPRLDIGRARSTADVERNLPATALTRADLGWRSLLHALPAIPEAPRARPRSVLLDAQGIAVLRRDAGRVYVALDFGHGGGGHGHPDRLNLLLADGAVRWLDDMGTGSYVDRALFWYRSTLAHNAPLIDGRSQERVHGRLLAYDERGAAGWVAAAVDGLAPGVGARRSVVVMTDYLIDEVSWSAPRDVVFDLPMHVDGELGGATPWRDASLVGGQSPEDGFEFARQAQMASVDPSRTACFAAHTRENSLNLWVHADHAAQWWRATAPGPPGGGQRRFHLLRVRARAGTIRSVWSWNRAVSEVALEAGRLEVGLADGTRHTHCRHEHGWHVDFLAGGARSSVDLGGLRDAPPSEPAAIGLYGDATTAVATATAEPRVLPQTFWLGERHYRRSEESWHDAGSPRATVSLAIDGPELRIDADVAKGDEPIFVASDAVNRYDNEHPDINGDGLQVYVRTPVGSGAWVVVPNPGGSSVRARPIAGWGDLAPPRGSWRRTDRGYAIELAVRLPAAAPTPAPIEVDVIVNETGPGRERRRGQLVMSGADGEFVYLAGDRHDPARLLPFLTGI